MRTRQKATATSDDIRPLGVVLNTDPVRDYAAEAKAIADQKATLDKQIADAQRQQDELAQQEADTIYAANEAKKREKADLLAMVKYYRELATEAPDREKADELIGWAMDCERRARAIWIEGERDELAPPPAALLQTKPSFLERHREVISVSVILLVGGLIWLAGVYFEHARDLILLANKALPPEQQMQPYDMTSYQKLAFEKMVQFSDLPVALILLLLVMPPVGIYVLPFVASKPDFWYEFKHELTPYQRCLLATCFVLGFLLLAGLAHLVKL